MTMSTHSLAGPTAGRVGRTDRLGAAFRRLGEVLTWHPKVQPMKTRAPRIALYSHDTLGLGHVRRNLLIAQALSGSFRGADVLVITGASETNAFTVSPGVDMLTLPGLYKLGNGAYRPRRLSFEIEELIALRSGTIQAALTMFQPDLFVVDNVPRGAVRELDPVLAYLRRCTPTRCVLGLRDVLDHPETVRREWNRADNLRAIREWYDAIWVYGDPDVYDLAEEYGLPPDVTGKLTFTGYLDGKARLETTDASEAIPETTRDRLHLCVVGGGQDGVPLAELFARSVLPEGAAGMIVTGPHMAPESQHRLSALSARQPGMSTTPFVREPTVLFRQAERVVSMGGYNTICELLSLEKRPLVMPRVEPRQEQLIRAERLSRLGLVHLMHPAEASPQAISRWMRRAQEPAESARTCVDMDGLRRIPALLASLLPQEVLPLPTVQNQRSYAV